MKPNRLLTAYLGLNRNLRILGTVALLLLGGLAVFIAWRQIGDVIKKRELDRKRTFNNTYFTSLVASGATTKDLLIKEIGQIDPYASGFIGLSRKKLTLGEARELAERTGAEILDIAVTAQKSRKELTGWLTDTYPAQQGSTVWVRDNLATKVIDCPDVLAVTTTKADDAVSSPPRQVFLRWPRTETWKNKGWSWTIQPQFDEVTPFSRWGLARVRAGKAWGVIDEAGAVVQPPTFDTIEPFGEQGSARVSQGGKWGLLDRAGKLVAAPEWEDVQHFINGFIPVQKDGKWGYLDASGKLTIPCDWDDAWRFSPEGFAVVTRDGKRGFIDKAGKVIVEPVWDGAVNFAKEGVGMVRRGAGWGLVDTAGQLLCEPNCSINWRPDRRFDLGLLRLYYGLSDRPEERYSALLDLYGKEVPESRCKSTIMRNDFFYCSSPERTRLIGANGQKLGTVAGEFRWESNELVHVLLREAETMGLADRKGEWVVRPHQFTTIRRFSEGLAPCLSKSRKWGFIDRAGKIVIKNEWDEVRDFSDGFAAVRRGNLWGFINRSGNVVAKPEWDEVRDFRDGVASVRRGFKWGLVGPDGEHIAEPAWTMIGGFSEGLAAVTSDPVRLYAFLTTSFVEKNGKAAFGGKTWKLFWRGVANEAPQFRNGFLKLEQLDSTNRVVQGRGLNLKGEESAAPEGKPGLMGLRTENPLSGGYGNHPFGYQGTDSYDGGRAAAILDGSGAKVVDAVAPGSTVLDDFIPRTTPPKYGVIDATGKTLVEPTWDEAHILSPEWVWFRQDEKIGLADRTGKVLIAPVWDALDVLLVEWATLAKDGKTILLGWGGKRFLSPWVRVKDGATTKILQINGQPAIPETLPDATYVDFYGPAHVVIKQPDGQGGFVLSLIESATGKQTRFPEAAALRWNWEQASHGLLWIRDKATSRWRLMGRDGHDFQHSQPLEEKPDGWGFVEGRAALHQPDGWVVVDTEVKPISPDKWQATHDFFEGRAAVQREGKWGFIALDGKVAVPQVWDAVMDFSRGLAAVQKDGRWGYLDPQGKVAIEPVWDSARDFWEWHGDPADDGAPVSMDVARVTIGIEAALIDRTGALLIDPAHRWMNFSVGAMLVEKDALIVMRKGEGAAVVPRAWGNAVAATATRGWRRADAAAGKGAPWLLIDEAGRPLTAAVWAEPWRDRETDPRSGGLITARDARQKYGLLHRDGTTALPPQFDRIAWIAPGVAAVWTKESGGLIDTKGDWIFRDDEKRRIARFGGTTLKTNHTFQHGLVVIEDVPKWGYARLNR